MPETRATFEEVLHLYGDALWRLTGGYAYQPADRDDLYQEVLLAVWGALPRFRGDSSLRTFVYRIAHNRGTTFRGRASARAKRQAEVSVHLRDPRPDADEELRTRLDRARLFGAIGELPPTLRRALMLSLEGLSYSEIAQILDITENNVGVRLHRARSALEELLKGEDRDA